MENGGYRKFEWKEFRKWFDETHAWKKNYNRFLFFKILIPAIIIVVILYLTSSILRS